MTNVLDTLRSSIEIKRGIISELTKTFNFKEKMSDEITSYRDQYLKLLDEKSKIEEILKINRKIELVSSKRNSQKIENESKLNKPKKLKIFIDDKSFCSSLASHQGMLPINNSTPKKFENFEGRKKLRMISKNQALKRQLAPIHEN
jgi:hypothetical protein